MEELRKDFEIRKATITNEYEEVEDNFFEEYLDRRCKELGISREELKKYSAMAIKYYHNN